MLSSEMLQVGRNACIIREISAYGAARGAEIGPENVFDFSIGNPNLPAPPVVRETLLRLLTEEDPVKLHAYTPAVGLPEVREAVARHITETFGLPVTRDSLYITEGASTALAMVFHAMCRPGDEVILFAPYFTEYPVFVRSAGAVPVEVPCAEPDFHNKVFFSAGSVPKLTWKLGKNEDPLKAAQAFTAKFAAYRAS